MSLSSDYPKALKEESTEGDASPGKTDKKKRGRVKEDPDAEGAEIDEPPAKKTKTRTKKEPKIKNEDADGGSENEAPGTRKPKSTVKKEPKIKNEDAETGDENEAPATKKPKSRAKKEPKIKNEDAETGSENEGLANKKTKAATNKGKKASGNDTDEDSKHDVQPIKKGRKPPKKARAADETALDVKDDSGDHETLPPPKERKKRAPRQATMAKKVKDEDIETDGVEPASELETPLGKFELEHTSELEPEASEDVPKLQKGRKGASAISSKRQVKKAKKGTKSKVTILFAFAIDLRADDLYRLLRMSRHPTEGRLAHAQPDGGYSTIDLQNVLVGLGLFLKLDIPTGGGA